MKAYLNGQWLDRQRAAVSIFDHGFLYGDTVYETIRIYESRPFLLDSHLRRFVRSAKALGLRCPSTKKKLEKIVLTSITINKLKEAVTRITLSRGVGPRGLDPRGCHSPTLAVSSEPLNEYPAWVHKKGLIIAVVNTRRNAKESLPPAIKSGNCLNGILAKQEAASVGAHEAMMLTLSNHVSEGSATNIFLVQEDRILTPPADQNILGGITRDFVCRIIQNSPFRLTQAPLTLKDLFAADEIFLTNTTLEIAPVRKIIVKGSFRPRRSWARKDFPHTQRLRSLFHDARLKMLKSSKFFTERKK